VSTNDDTTANRRDDRERAAGVERGAPATASAERDRARPDEHHEDAIDGRDAHGGEAFAPLPEREELPPASDEDGWARLLDRIMAIHRPIVVRQIRALRRAYPRETPDELVRRIERQYLTAVTATGGGAGAAAVVPGLGTAASLGVTGVETVAFLEMTALFGQSIAEIHGLALSDPQRARTLVQSLMLGDASRSIIDNFARIVAGRAAGRPVASSQAFWGEMITRSMPQALMGELSKQIQSMFLKRFLPRQSASAVGRLVPFGIGAVIGGVGNHLLARRVVETSRTAFGPAPAGFPLDLHPVAAQRPAGPGTTPELEGRSTKLFFLTRPRGRAAREIEPGSTPR